MSQIEPKDWLDWHSIRIAQEHAVRLSCFCSAVVPTDKNFSALVEEQIRIDLVGLAFHGRRTMERHGLKSASIGSDPLWPSSAVQGILGKNLWDAFGIIIHASEFTVCWESADLAPNPYGGRKPQFAGHVTVKSDSGETKIAIGSVVASFIGSVLNKLPATTQP